MGYVKKTTTSDLNRELEVLTITLEGKVALQKVKDWLDKLKGVPII